MQYSVHWFLPIILWVRTTESFNFFNLFNNKAPGFSLPPVRSSTHYTHSTSSSSSTRFHDQKTSSSTVPPQPSSAVHNSTKENSSLAQTDTLPYLPDIRNLSQLEYAPPEEPIGRSGRPDSQKYLPNNLTPYQEAQLNLAQFTSTDLACYIAPPSNEIIDMSKV